MSRLHDCRVDPDVAQVHGLGGGLVRRVPGCFTDRWISERAGTRRDSSASNRGVFVAPRLGWDADRGRRSRRTLGFGCPVLIVGVHLPELNWPRGMPWRHAGTREQRRSWLWAGNHGDPSRPRLDSAGRSNVILPPLGPSIRGQTLPSRKVTPCFWIVHAILLSNAGKKANLVYCVVIEGSRSHCAQCPRCRPLVQAAGQRVWRGAPASRRPACRPPWTLGSGSLFA